ncbi:unnamed protein product [Parascedosporium putredinis]|uniref:Methyltransferase type 11 domain-containing protein n=1 Tax=Parascedosporium putredinis TaxID=1442378 RepID=A0A9P1H0J4_9PEZI|nr:unnamed protein product [Parascedosporium putredinis]CAI7992774.1 unnamed protein product [Parascedosporium putredinis]
MSNLYILPSTRYEPGQASQDQQLPQLNPWYQRSSVMTDSTEFEDMYEGLEEENNRRRSQNSTAASRPNSLQRQSAIRVRSGGLPSPRQANRRSLPKLAIPSGRQAEIDRAPSLDGSLTSEQMAQMSAPPTPVMGSVDGDCHDEWSGVQLQPAESQVFELPEGTLPEMQMQQQGLRLLANFTHLQQADSGDLSSSPAAASRASMLELSKLDIPSPGGFFAELSPRTRRTWDSLAPDTAPPTSTTAEQFYKLPWNRPSTSLSLTSNGADLIEQIVEIRDDIVDEDDVPTARPIVAPTPQTATFDSTGSTVTAAPASEDDVEPTEIVSDCDPTYARMQQQVALANLDRTESWLVAQDLYLKRVISPDAAVLPGSGADRGPTSPPMPSSEMTPAGLDSNVETPPKKKTVRFSEAIDKPVAAPAVPCKIPEFLSQNESAYYRAFQDYVIRSRDYDAFVSRVPRYEALQSQRISLPAKHRSQLLGKYQLSVVPQSAKKRLSTNVARGDDVIVEDPERLRQDRESEALAQMVMNMWHVAGVKLLNGGRLVMAPVGRKLMRLSTNPMLRSSHKDKPRILDLGGQVMCDWAWHISLQYPNAKVYTVSVNKLTSLPFPDNHFDLVSARELHSILKYTGENGEDEWETCLRECMRVLKPGGYLDFALMDADIMKAGPLGLAKSLFLSRLARAGFVSARRTWTFLPVGPRITPGSKAAGASSALRPNADGTEPVTHQLQAIASPSEVAAPLRGRKVAGELRLCDTVTSGEAVCEAGKCLVGTNAIVEEGRKCGAGWRMLSGYARKPMGDSEEEDGIIPIRLM